MDKTATDNGSANEAVGQPSPIGMDLRPKAPQGKRMSKRLGAVVVVALGALVAVIVYGIFHRQTAAANLARRGGDLDARVTGAKEAGRQFSNPPGSPVETASPDQLEPPPLKFVPRGRDGKALAVVQPVGGATERKPGNVAMAGAGRTGNNTVPAALRSGAHPAGGNQPPGWESPNAAAWSGPNGGAGAPSDAAALIARAKDREREAMDAATGINGSGPAGMRGGPSAQGEANELAGLVNALGGPSGGGSGGSGARTMPPSGNTISGASIAPREAGDDDSANQASKDDFLRKARKGGGAENYAQGTRIRALSPFEIKAGWDIPAVLEQDINSDLPGEIRALVRETVYDTASGRYLLVPQGARLVGTYDSKVAYAQNALLVVWSRIIFPDGSSIDLEGMGSQDVRGQSGLRGKVNNHYGRLFGTAVLSTAFSAAAVVAQNRRQNVFTVPSSQDVATSAAASEIARLGAAITRKNLNIQPTIRILTGTRFSVRVHKDLLFEEPYRPYRQGGEKATSK